MVSLNVVRCLLIMKKNDPIGKQEKNFKQRKKNYIEKNLKLTLGNAFFIYNNVVVTKLRTVSFSH